MMRRRSQVKRLDHSPACNWRKLTLFNRRNPTMSPLLQWRKSQEFSHCTSMLPSMTPRTIYWLHTRNFYQQRLDKKRNAEIAKRNRERLQNPSLFPAVPKDLPWHWKPPSNPHSGIEVPKSQTWRAIFNLESQALLRHSTSPDQNSVTSEKSRQKCNGSAHLHVGS